MKIYESNSKKNLITTIIGVVLLMVGNFIGGVIGSGISTLGLIFLFIGGISLVLSIFSKKN